MIILVIYNYSIWKSIIEGDMEDRSSTTLKKSKQIKGWMNFEDNYSLLVKMTSNWENFTIKWPRLKDKT